jgi:hypothetical protein
MMKYVLIFPVYLKTALPKSSPSILTSCFVILFIGSKKGRDLAFKETRTVLKQGVTYPRYLAKRKYY